MKPTTVCVSGVSGFIGAQVAYDLLSKGYKVHGTVRKNTVAKTQHLTSHPKAATNLEIFEADLLQPESFTKALEGCDGAIHVASPYVMTVKDPQKELVDPAVIGTKGFLECCKKVGSVKKIVVTSSVAAISDEGRRDGKKFTENDWNTKSSLKRLPYYFSKAEAERALWKWTKDNEGCGIKVVVINPFVVIGPSLVKSMNQSASFLRDTAAGNSPGVVNLVFTFVDVRDVSLAHILALESDSAEGRYICAADPAIPMKEIIHLTEEEGFKPKKMNMTGPVLSKVVKVMSYVLPGGTQGQFVRNNIGAPLQVSNEKIRKDLKIDFRSPQTSVKETLSDLVKWGHLVKKSK